MCNIREYSNRNIEIVIKCKEMTHLTLKIKELYKLV